VDAGNIVEMIPHPRRARNEKHAKPRKAGLARRRLFPYTVGEVNNMDKEKRKQLQEAYKNRKPQMGVIAIILM